MNIRTITFLVTMIFTGILMGIENDGFGSPNLPTTKSKLLEPIYTKLNSQIAEKYHLWLCGKGGKIQETIKIVMMAYNLKTSCPISRDDARAMIVNIVEKYIHAFNSNNEIRSYMVEYPFTFNNFGFKVFIFRNSNADIFYDPNLALVTANYRGITFYTESPTDPYGYASEENEPYEEALEKVKAQGKLDLSFIQGN